MATTVRDAAALLACWPATAPTTPRTPSTAAWPASGSVCPASDVLGLHRPRRRRRRAGGRAAGRRGRHDRRRHRPACHGGLRLGRRAAGPARRAPAAGWSTTSPPAPATCRARWRTSCLQPRARRRGAGALRAVAVRAARWPGPATRGRGVRRGAGALRDGTRRDGHRRGAARAPARRAGDPVVRPREPDRPGQPRGAPGLLHERRGDGRLPAAHRADRAGGRPAGGGVVLGTADSEATLVEIAHGYERARNRATGPLPEPTFPPFV